MLEKVDKFSDFTDNSPLFEFLWIIGVSTNSKISYCRFNTTFYKFLKILVNYRGVINELWMFEWNYHVG